jgi:hypothetical protein
MKWSKSVETEVGIYRWRGFEFPGSADPSSQGTVRYTHEYEMGDR